MGKYDGMTGWDIMETILEQLDPKCPKCGCAGNFQKVSSEYVDIEGFTFFPCGSVLEHGYAPDGSDRTITVDPCGVDR